MRIESNKKQLRIFITGASALLLINLMAMWSHSSTNTGTVTKSSTTTSNSHPKAVTPTKKIPAALNPYASLAAVQTPQTLQSTHTSNSVLMIKEWGVQLPLSSALTGLKYKLRGNEIRFSTPGLESAGCSASSIGLPLGLVRSSSQIVTDFSQHDGLETSFRKLKGQWYALSGANAMCFSAPPTSASLATYQQTAAALEPALHQLQPL